MISKRHKIDLEKNIKDNLEGLDKARVVKEMSRLMKLDDYPFYNYMVNEDNLSAKITESDREEIITKASASGKNLALKIKEENGDNITLKELISKEGIEFIVDDSPINDMFFYFGAYDTGVGGRITIYKKSLQPAKDLINMISIQGISDKMVDRIIIGHELFHYYEEQIPGLYCNQKEIELWKFGPFTKKSSLSCPAEISAMAFCEEILGLNFNPVALNYLLFISVDEEVGFDFYQKVIK